jgi:hypothetical protein
MSMLRSRRRPAQLPLFAYLHSKPQTSPSWAALSTDVQQKMVQLLAQLFRHHCTRCRAAGAAKEVADE